MFRLPTRTVIAPGALNRLPEAVAGRHTVLMVTDPGLSATPWPDRARTLLRGAGHDVRLTDEVAANPRSADIDRIADQARNSGVDAVVGLGGGSVLDTAKAVAMLMQNPGSCRAYEGRNRFSGGSAPFVAIPTTCGTGSEVTWVSVISVPDEGRKISVKGDGMFPTWALVDPDLLVSLPASLVAETGMDALTHAVEAYIGRASNPASDALAEAAVRLLVESLPAAVSDIAGNAPAREAVMRGSTLAGIAFGNADVGAVHCLSESIGGLFDLPHGRLNAILLAPVLRDHGRAAAARLARLSHRTGLAGRDDAEAGLFVDLVTQLTTDLGLPTFADLNIPVASFDQLATLAAGNGSNDANPRPMPAPVYRKLLDSLV